MPTDRPHVRALRKLGACEEGLVYAATQPSMAATWANCERGHWMLWLAGRTEQ